MRTRRAAILLTAWIVVVSWPALGEGGELRLVPGLTPFQFAMAAAIDIVCPRLAAARSTLNPVQIDLLDRCSEMRQTANELQGDMPTNLSLGLSNAELADALGAVAPEEASTLGTLSVETGTTPARAIGARLRAVRAGASGLSLSGLKIGVDQAMVSAGRLLGLTESGGGASADRGPFGRLGIFLNGEYDFGDRDRTSREEGFDFDRFGFTAGADYRVTDSLVLGLAFHYSQTDVDIDLGLGEVDSQAYGASLYGTYYLGRFFVDAHGSYEFIDYDTTRRIVYATFDRTARGETDGDQYTVNLGVGYEIPVGRVTITPLVRAEYLNLQVDRYRERGAEGLDLDVGEQDVESLVTAVGAQASMAFSVPFGVLVPQIRSEWRHEFENNGTTITAKYANDPFNTFFAIPTDDPDRDYVAVAAGASAVFSRGVSAFVNYETVLGLRDVTHHAFTGGVRMEF
ncbi:MAG TPA: autotransporter outer membrane beta-barrel domain-containing protein [Methylomirabilota bacterium]|nr:autotransporter outer membrane beta-barrel domain-containing protein [Methylomirabilota bacterium]